MTYHFQPPLANISRDITPANDKAAALSGSQRGEIVRSIPALCRFAKRLTGNADCAEDLVQEAVLRGMANLSKFQPGTNMQAWLVTILRNLFLTQCRQRRHDLAYKATLWSAPSSSSAHQYNAIQLHELENSLQKVSGPQRKALLLICAYGYSYEEAAAICGCPAGTVKSRANRARAQLAKLMDVDDTNEFGPAKKDLAVIAAEGSGGINQQPFH